MPNSSAPQTTPKGERAEALPSNLRRLRLEAQLTLDRLGALSGVSRAMISKIERGASVPTATVLGKLAAALQVSLSQLLGGFHARQPRLHGRERQAVYHDPASGFERRSLSPLFEDGAVDLAFNVLPQGKSVEFPRTMRAWRSFSSCMRGRLPWSSTEGASTSLPEIRCSFLRIACMSSAMKAASRLSSIS